MTFVNDVVLHEPKVRYMCNNRHGRLINNIVTCTKNVGYYVLYTKIKYINLY